MVQVRGHGDGADARQRGQLRLQRRQAARQLLPVVRELPLRQPVGAHGIWDGTLTADLRRVIDVTLCPQSQA